MDSGMEARRAGDDRDRTSELPSVILMYILAFLPLKLAFRCSILSKSWMAAWQGLLARATALDFGKDFATKMLPEQYLDAVDRMVAVHQAPTLDSLKIFFHWLVRDPLHRHRVIAYLKFAALKHVSELEVHLNDCCPSTCPIPGKVLHSGHLARLSLRKCVLVHMFDPLELPALRDLSLERVNVTDDTISAILAHCSHLANLKLIRCSMLEFVEISSPPSLRHLTVQDCCRGVAIEAPMLETLNLEIYSCEFVLKDVTGVKEACVAIRYFRRNITNTNYLMEMHWALLSALQGVTTLTWSGPLLLRPLMKMAEQFDKLTFRNLKIFRYQSRDLTENYMGLPSFLHFCNFPSLVQICD